MKETKKILILGGSGYVGRHLFKRLGAQRAVATYHNKFLEGGVRFDSLTMELSQIVTDPSAISHAVILLGDIYPHSCAADPQKSNKLNIESIQRIIDDLTKWNIKPIFASSEYLFDGAKGYYREDDPPSPILLYGKQKLAIENYLQARAGDNHVVLRVSKVVGSELDDRTLFSNWLDAIGKTYTIKCAQEQVFSPIYVHDVVEGILRVIEQDCRGLFHLTGPQAFYRLDLLKMLLECVGKYSPVNIKIVPCSIQDFTLLEKHPVNVSMVPDKLVRVTGLKLTDMKTVCEKIVRSKYETAVEKYH